MSRVFATCDIGRDALDLVRAAGHDLEVWPDLGAPPRDVMLDRARTCDALVTTLRDRIDRELLMAGKATQLRVVAQDAVGLDNVDVGAARELGVVVTNTADVLTEATAEFAVFMLGDAARRLAPSEALVREGRWGSWHPWHPMLGTEVTGKTVAIVGCGRIGRAFASKCTGFDLNLLLVAKSLPAGWLEGIREIQRVRHASGVGRHAWTEVVSLDEALPRADFVSLHVPLVKEGPGATLRLLSTPQFSRMKRTAFLVNTSRGPVVDEGALATALREGLIAGAALDVFETEPLPLDSPLLADELKDRVRVYHHFASGTRETRLGTDPDVGMAGRCVAGLLDALGDAPTYRFAVVRPG